MMAMPRLVDALPRRYIVAVRRPTFLQSLIRSEPVRVAQLAAGAALMTIGPVVGALVPIPFPVGLTAFGIGLALVLRNSGWARRRYVRWKRRYPRAGRITEFGLQRHRRPGDFLRRRPRPPPPQAPAPEQAN